MNLRDEDVRESDCWFWAGPDDFSSAPITNGVESAANTAVHPAIHSNRALSLEQLCICIVQSTRAVRTTAVSFLLPGAIQN